MQSATSSNAWPRLYGGARWLLGLVDLLSLENRAVGERALPTRQRYGLYSVVRDPRRLTPIPDMIWDLIPA